MEELCSTVFNSVFVHRFKDSQEVVRYVTHQKHCLPVQFIFCFHALSSPLLWVHLSGCLEYHLCLLSTHPLPISARTHTHCFTPSLSLLLSLSLTHFLPLSLSLSHTISHLSSLFFSISLSVSALCTRHIGTWLALDPTHYFKDDYLKYIGWMCFDYSAAVRKEAVRSVRKLLKVETSNWIQCSDLLQFSMFFYVKPCYYALNKLTFNTSLLHSFNF